MPTGAYAHFGLALFSLIVIYIFFRAIFRRKFIALPPRRKVALSLWDSANEAYIHTSLEMDVHKALPWLKERSKERSLMLSLTHLVGAAVGKAISDVPEFNRTLVWDGFIQHSKVDVSFLVALDDGEDTDWVKVEEAEKKSVGDIAVELTEAAKALRAKVKGKRGGGLVDYCPVWFLRPMMKVTGFLASGLGFDLSAIGIDPYSFGRAVVVNSASFGAEEAFVTRTAFSYVGMNLIICRLTDRVVVREGKQVIRPCFNLCVNADHRYVDGSHLSRTLKAIRRYIENPELLEKS